MEKLTAEVNLWFFGLESMFFLLTFSRKLCSKILSFLTSPSKNIRSRSENRAEPKTEDQISISTEDITKVMETLGLPFHDNEFMKKTAWKAEEISALFQDQEPSLEEAKEAFSVFDDNGDGFVNAEELRRAFCKLGFRGGGLELDSCKKMIDLYDEDGDGLIGFDDFVKLAESSFC
ncbi:probable calcium-binding protein CML30 [Phalaenopsis equestris]|uniref:probable calcium-binding protein CML30 n=1 Tax=Phalaenopsis equestris TaxID=78828 RepID=UPI0009E5E8FA|nr:probable calcium-binding protein CML30 [Phalaenopsis equestris]